MPDDEEINWQEWCLVIGALLVVGVLETLVFLRSLTRGSAP